MSPLLAKIQIATKCRKRLGQTEGKLANSILTGEMIPQSLHCVILSLYFEEKTYSSQFAYVQSIEKLVIQNVFSLTFE